MTQILKNFLTGAKNKDFATATGTQMHTLLQRVIIDNDNMAADSEIVQNIKNRPNLKPFFAKNAMTEVSIAGNIHDHFISRRIDRMLIDHTTQTIDFLDYKTDTDKVAFIDKYKKQLQEYAELLRSAHPNYKINGYILWLRDWDLEKII